VHLKTDIEFVTKTIWDVIARIDGAAERDRWVVLGNHRDAWVFGAVDPNSGTTAMLELARGLGQLMKSGWKPRRSIILGSWDAEEQGLIGSTEWAEENAAELKEKAVAYLNVDVAVSGPNFSASSVPSMWKLIWSAAQDVRDPKTGKSLYDAWHTRVRADLAESELYDANGNEKPASSPRIGALGSGSDYTPFLQHLGVPSLDMGFGGITVSIIRLTIRSIGWRTLEIQPFNIMLPPRKSGERLPCVWRMRKDCRWTTRTMRPS